MNDDPAQRIDPYADWQAIVDAAPLGIYVMSCDGKFIFVNHAWCDLFAVEAVQALGDGWTRMIHPGDYAQVMADLQHARDHHAGMEREYRIVRPDGGVRWISDRFAARFSADGTVLDFVGLLRDITKRRRGEDENQFLVQIGALLSDAPSFEAALQQLAVAIVPRMGAAIALLVRDGDTLDLAAVAGSTTEVRNASMATSQRHCGRLPPTMASPRP
ncbi:PAS domain S-box protein [Candidatus Gracilibacteria bacterium]|nr:PAS domain S-box protein [Candidatus Gracilibacteria bacterium]